MHIRNFIAIASAILVSISVSMCLAVTNTWTGASDTDWFNTNNWDKNAVPTDGDYAIINDAIHTNVSLTNSTANLASFTITNNCSLIFSNWDTTLNATNVTIENSGILTLPAAFTNNGISNRVHISCTDFTIEDGGTVNVAEKGYVAQQGPGGYTTGQSGGGGGYGGEGGAGSTGGASNGITYGSVSAPTDPGSGGCHTSGGSGGGAVFIEASGTATINGVITANGDISHHGVAGGGSGGSIYITCDTLDGSTNGILSVNGGYDYTGSGGGGGGRIAVVYTNTPGGTWPGIRFSASPGSGFTNIGARAAVQGTLYLSDTIALSNTLTNNLFTDVSLYISNLTSWAVNSLTVSNCTLTFGADSFQLTITNNLLVGNSGGIGVDDDAVLNCGVNITVNGGKLRIGTNCALNCGGNMLLTNGGSLHALAGMTNGIPEDYGALVNITGDVYIASNSWIYSSSHETDGGSPLFRMNNLTIASTNAGFNADIMGYASGTGPGAGYYSTYGYEGGGYGGRGGKGIYNAGCGNTYGSLSAPTDPGSGGCFTLQGGYGGGLVRIEAGGTVTINGMITANGGQYGKGGGGGGSGGGIYITCNTLDGSTNGILRANGGTGTASGWLAGGGGGGRIAVVYTNTPGGTWPGIRFSTSPGPGFTNIGIRAAVQGTLYLPDIRALSDILTDSLFTDVSLFSPGFTSWAVDSLTVSNCSLTFGADSFQLTVTNNLVVGNSGGIGVDDDAVFNCGSNITVNGGKLSIGTNCTLNCGGNLVLTNDSSFYVQAGMTNGIAEDYGVLVSITGNVYIASNSWVYSSSHDTDGGSPLFRMNDLVIASTNAGFSANEMGYGNTNGPGAGTGGANPYGYDGGGYGGKGGRGIHGGTNGNTYGSSNAPVDPGSGGCHMSGGYGGGLVRIEAHGDITVDGVVTANGQNQLCSRGGGGGSGGGIYIMCCGTFGADTNGILSANGGDGQTGSWGSGGGGGGRIAVWYEVSESDRTRILAGDMTRVCITNVYSGFLGIASVTGGLGYTNDPPNCAYPGTKVFLKVLPPPGTTFRFY